MKTVTMRVDDSIYNMIAYDGQTGHQSRRHPATPFRDIFCNTILS